MSTAFDFMTIWQFYDWFEKTSSLYRNRFTFDEVYKFSMFGSGQYDTKKRYINYRGLVSSLDNTFSDFASEAAGENILEILENGDGSIPRWDYESLCNFIGETPYLLLPYGEVKYFWGRKSAACPAHIDRLLSALRYRVLQDGRAIYGAWTSFRGANVGPENWRDTISAAQEYINSEFTKSWKEDSWTDGSDSVITYQKTSSASFYYDDLPGPNSIKAGVYVSRYRILIDQRFAGRYHLYGVPQKHYQDPTEQDKKNGNVVVHTTGGLYQNLPEVPEWGKWYKLYDHLFRESTSADDIQIAYWGYDKMPTPPPLIAYSSDQENKKTSYREGFHIDQMVEIYDIQPEKPTTFLP